MSSVCLIDSDDAITDCDGQLGLDKGLGIVCSMGMSKTYNLVCPETKRAIWVGQGGRLYGSGDAIERLAKWLHDHEGREILFVEDEHPALDGIDFGDWDGMEDD